MITKISERNIFPNFNLYNEYMKLEHLISEKLIIGEHTPFMAALASLGGSVEPVYTIEQCVEEYNFFGWEIKGTFTSISDMRRGLNIEKERFNESDISDELVLDFIQYAMNCVARAEEVAKIYKDVRILDDDVLEAIKENMEMLVKRLGAKFHRVENTSEWFIVYSDDLSTVVAKDYPEIEISLVEYKKIDNKGNLTRKAEILCTLSKRLEKERKKFKGTEFNSLCEDTFLLLNNAEIRHCPNENDVVSQKFSQMLPVELEIWYDRTYTMFLSCMVALQYLDIKSEIKAIKSEVK